MVRNRITTKGRIKKKSGEFEGPDYTPWIKVADFSGQGWGSLIDCHVSERAAHALAHPEVRVRLLTEWRLNVLDIRESYPLPLEETLAIAKDLGVKHPSDNKRQPNILTLDVLANCRDEVGVTWQEAHDYKSRSSIADRYMAEIDIKEMHCRILQRSFKLWTESDIDMVLTDNLIHVRFYHDDEDFPTVTRERLTAFEPTLFNELTSSDLPMSWACLEIDRKCGFSLGTGLCMVYRLIWKRAWEVDLSLPLVPDEQPLEIISRNPKELWHAR